MLFLPVQITDSPFSPGQIQTVLSGGFAIVTDLEYYGLGQSVLIRVGSATFEHNFWRVEGCTGTPSFPGSIGEFVTFKDVAPTESGICIRISTIETSYLVKPIQDKSEKS